MRFTLEAEPEELSGKSDALLQALIKAFSSANPEFAERLSKALPERQQPVELRLPVLRELHRQTAEAYQRQLELMVKDIGKVLDKSINAPTLQKGFFDYTKELADEQGFAYRRVKSALKAKGHTDADFAEGGAFYGASVNDLLRILREYHIEPDNDMHKGR